MFPVEASYHCYEVEGGTMKDEAVALLQEFYARGNPNAPKPHRAVITAPSVSHDTAEDDGSAMAAKKPRVDTGDG
jgi:hypothetical protein